MSRVELDETLNVVRAIIGIWSDGLRRISEQLEKIELGGKSHALAGRLSWLHAQICDGLVGIGGRVVEQNERQQTSLEIVVIARILGPEGPHDLERTLVLPPRKIAAMNQNSEGAILDSLWIRKALSEFPAPQSRVEGPRD